MISILDELAQVVRDDRIRCVKISNRRKTSTRTEESSRAARARLILALDGLAEDLEDQAAIPIVLRMLKAAGVKLNRPLTEALRRGDEVEALAVNEFMGKVRQAIAKACRETTKELK